MHFLVLAAGILAALANLSADRRELRKVFRIGDCERRESLTGHVHLVDPGHTIRQRRVSGLEAREAVRDAGLSLPYTVERRGDQGRVLGGVLRIFGVSGVLIMRCGGRGALRGRRDQSGCTDQELSSPDTCLAEIDRTLRRGLILGHALTLRMRRWSPPPPGEWLAEEPLDSRWSHAAVLPANVGRTRKVRGLDDIEAEPAKRSILELRAPVPARRTPLPKRLSRGAFFFLLPHRVVREEFEPFVARSPMLG